HAAQPPGGGGDQLVEVGALGQAAGDPHHGGVGGQRGEGGVGVGGLGVVDVGDAVDVGDVGDAVLLRAEGAQPVTDGGGRHAVGAGECRGGQRVGHHVR